MAQKNENSVVTEVDKRLDDLFGGSDNSIQSFEKNAEITISPLRELKAIVLSIDWEIDDEIMTKLIEELAKLKQAYQNDKVLLMFLQLLGSTGKYIKANKANAHPDSIKILNSVFIGLERVVITKGITEQDRKRILLAEVEKFKKLKDQIAPKKAAPEVKKEEEEPPIEMEAVVQGKEQEMPAKEEKESFEEEPHAVPLTDTGISTMQEPLLSALNEIKQVLKSEFKALRAELQKLKEGK